MFVQVNHSWSKNMPKLQQLEAQRRIEMNIPNGFYTSVSKGYNPEPGTQKIITATDRNAVTFFSPSSGSNGVIAITYNSNMCLRHKTQAEPDIVLDFQNSKYDFKHIIGIDHKAINWDTTRLHTHYSHLISCKEAQYERIIENCRRDYMTTNLMTPKRNQLLYSLIDAKSQSSEIRLHIWFELLAEFPINKIPPVFMSEGHIFHGRFSDETKEKFHQATIELTESNSLEIILP